MDTNPLRERLTLSTPWRSPPFSRQALKEREIFIDILLVRIHLVIVMIRWTGLVPWEFESLVMLSLASTFLDCSPHGTVALPSSP